MARAANLHATIQGRAVPDHAQGGPTRDAAEADVPVQHSHAGRRARRVRRLSRIGWLNAHPHAFPDRTRTADRRTWVRPLT